MKQETKERIIIYVVGTLVVIALVFMIATHDAN